MVLVENSGLETQVECVFSDSDAADAFGSKIVVMYYCFWKVLLIWFIDYIVIYL